MTSKLINNAPQRTYAVIFETGDEVASGLERFAREESLSAAQFTALGALSDVTLGYFDWDKKDYIRIPVHDQVEVVSMVGDIALEGDMPKVHAHLVVSNRHGETRGGHLLGAVVRPTLEVILTESPAHLRRVVDKESGLALIKAA